MKVLEGLNLGWRTRLPMMQQAEAAECGLACVAMVGSFYGYQAELTDLRRRFGLSLRGATLKDVVYMADRLKLASRPVRLELDELKRLKTPCILHWDLNHFVVLRKVTLSGVILHDPAVGVRKLSLAEVSKHFTGVALELTPMSGFEPSDSPPRVRMLSLLGQLVGIKQSLGQVFVMAATLQVFSMISPLFMQWVIDNALVSADRDLLLTLVLGFGLLIVVNAAVRVMRSWMLIVLGTSITVQGRANLFGHLLSLPASFFEKRYLADVMSRFGSQQTILDAVTTDLIEVVLDGFLVCATLIIMIVYAPSLTVVVVAGAGLYGLLRWASYAPLRAASAEAIAWKARRDSHFLETLRGVKTIKLFNAQEARRTQWLNLMIETVNRQLTTQKMRLLYRSSRRLVYACLGMLVIWMGAQRVLSNTFSVGMLLAFIAYKDQFLSCVSALIDRVLDLHMLRIHAERLADIALTDPERHAPSGDLDIQDNQPLSVEVRNLRFRYSANDPWVLDGISFRVEPGESVAIVGASGCGKTTLLKLLSSLLEPGQGEILVDDQPLGHFGVDRYRALIGVVMQDDQLFAGSIADNICFFAESRERKRIEDCAQRAAVHDDILAMPMSYDTLIGDMGTVLSGGQKQRVLIARALYREPSILLLDEATSYLDVQGEKKVNAAIRASNVTRIIVAHRPETIRSASRVITLDQGKIVKDETGWTGVSKERVARRWKT